MEEAGNYIDWIYILTYLFIKQTIGIIEDFSCY